MEYMTLNNGMKMPLLGLGTWDLRGQQCIDTVVDAIDVGYRLIDTAQMYGNEKEIGLGIKQSGISRNELFLTTKIYGNYQSYQKTKDAIIESLNNLQTDYLDLVLLHEPYSKEIEMYQALEEAYQQGIVKAIGISNYDERRFKKFIKHCHVKPMVNQIENHVYYQKWEYQQLLEQHNIKVQAWAPLASSLKDISHEPILLEIGNKYHKTPQQIALCFLVQRKISVIPKSKRKSRLKENIDIFDFVLSDEDINKIKQLDNHYTLFPWTKMF